MYTQLSKNSGPGLRRWFVQEILDKRFNSFTGWVILCLASIVISYLVALLGYPDAYFVLCGVSGIILLITVMLKPAFGFFFTLVYSFLQYYVVNILIGNYDLKPGLVVDVCIWVTFFAILLTKASQKDRNWSYYSSLTSIGFLLFFVYVIVQIANPEKPDFGGWAQFARRELTYLLLFYSVIELFNDMKFIRTLTSIWLILATIAAVYGIIQEAFGFLPAEMKFIHMTENNFRLIFVDGHFRKFAYFSDPTSYGIFMGLSSLFFLSMITGPLTVSRKVLYFFLSLLMILGMVFSGTRTAYAMVPIGFFLHALMTINKKSSYVIVISIVSVLAVIVYGPFHNPSVERVRSLFLGSNDPSLNIRNVNRHHIQPYVYAHPLGGGVFTSGVNGLVYNKGHVLAGFPPDSELLRITLEIGYIGLLLFMARLYFPIREAIIQYFACRDELVKTYYIAFGVCLFSIVVSLYSQEVSLETDLFIVSFSAIILKMKEFDTASKPAVL